MDYRRLNSLITGDTYSMPRIDELLHLAKQTPYMATISLRSGYWQVAFRTSDGDKTAFTTSFGTYRFKRMPLGLRKLWCLMERFRARLSGITTFPYLDDLIVLSSDFRSL